MIALLVTLNVKPECLSEFRALAEYDAECTIKEDGNVCFDVHVSADDPCKYIFYEVYRDEAALEFHRTTEHYIRWRDESPDLLVSRGAEKFETAVFTDR